MILIIQIFLDLFTKMHPPYIFQLFISTFLYRCSQFYENRNKSDSGLDTGPSCLYPE